tara:strand:+ start:20 stop:586 length:567 start_codon:yes stop_codon:yes gene_type:complete
MKLTVMQNKLLEFVTKKHGEQKRKYTGEPYVNHCVQVAEIVSDYEENCIEIALCHDLFEDTDCDFTVLYKEMVRIGFSISEAYNVCTYVNELTDVFTRENYPHLNRRNRKVLESKRLGTISYVSQSVKYADLINNTESIVANDKEFAKVYLSEKESILKLMNKGNSELFCNCLKSVQNAKRELSNKHH